MSGLTAEIKYECREELTYDDEGRRAGTIFQLVKVTTVPNVKGACQNEVIATFKNQIEYLLFKQFMVVAEEYMTRGVIHSHD